jgi:hypothetical protein
VSIPPCDIHLTELDVKQLLLVFTAGYVAPPVLTDIQLTDAFRRLFLRQSRTSARLQLVSERMVMSLATVIRAPSSTALSRTSCELLVLWMDIHLTPDVLFLRIQGGDFSMCSVIISCSEYNLI